MRIRAGALRRACVAARSMSTAEATADVRPWSTPLGEYRVVEVRDGRRSVLPYYDVSKMFAKHRYAPSAEDMSRANAAFSLR